MTDRKPAERAFQVLLADSATDHRAFVRQTLSLLSLDITEARDGGEAFTFLLDRRFDLLVTDLGMAPIDGAKLVMAVQLLPAATRPKVIVYSPDFSSVSPAMRLALRNADYLLEKPIVAASLIGAATSILGLTS